MFMYGVDYKDHFKGRAGKLGSLKGSKEGGYPSERFG
jgi:hypothetical protein